MPWVTEEEIQAAKNMTAYEYLRTHQAQRLQKTRTRNEWQLTDHDSFKINELSSKWHWKSRDIGGVSALRFLIEVDPLSVINNLSTFIFSLIRAIGLILLGFGVVQVGLSLKSHDPSQRANGFLTLAGGVIITFAKEILDLIMA